jgi:PAS domain S-box-containing protein
MKKNLPVTQREIDYSESEVFITKTDVKGIVTYANDSFVHISGFSREELVGKNHNVVRHPDMPPWAFGDLWETVKSGHPWRGLVKNRAKNGDHYWVRATVSPIMEGSRIIGYLSLRKKPSREEIAQAEALYRSETPPSTRSSFHKFKNLSLQTKIQLLIQPILLVLLGIATVFIYQEIKATMMESAKNRAESAAMQVIDSANMLMVTGAISNPDDRKLLIEKIMDGQKLKGLRLLRTDAVAKQFGPGLPEERIDDSVVKATIAASEKAGRSIPYFDLEKRNGIPVFRVITPYLQSKNFHGTDCQTCHQVEVGKVNGASDIEIDMSRDFSKLNRFMIGLIIGQLLLQVLLFFFIGFIVRKFIGKPVEEIKTHLNDLVNGNMTGMTDISGRDEMGEILCSVQSTKVLLGAIIDQIGSVSSRIDDGSGHLKHAMADVTRSSQAQSEAASNMASAVEEMTVSIDQVSENASEVRRVSENSKAKADDGGRIVRQVVEDMGRINTAVENAAETIKKLDRKSSEIQDVAVSIREIADQTNLLALNAAIEAARAGEAGRGFAVVADEVRKLAERTGTATQEITATIDEIRSETLVAVSEMSATVEVVKTGMALTEKAGSSIVEIDDGANQVLSGVEDISTSIQEQSQASREIAVNVEKVAQMSEQNSEAVVEVSKAVESLEALSGELSQSVGSFRI